MRASYSAMRWAGVNIPLLFLFNALFGMYGVVWEQFVGDCLVALATWLVYRHFRKKKLPQLRV